MEKDYTSDSWNIREKKAVLPISPFCMVTIEFELDRCSQY